MQQGRQKKGNLVFRSYMRVRKAVPDDMESVYQIASSLGKGDRDPAQGFLVDNYASRRDHYLEKFTSLVHRLDHFYVAENVSGIHKSRIVGFLIAYTRSQWLEDNPTWLEDVYWHPEFDSKRLKKFAVVDKTAIQAQLTGHGIGSELYKRLLADLAEKGITTILAETVISPVPNFASLAFRKKQNYTLAGIRYEPYAGEVITDLIYYKETGDS